MIYPALWMNGNHNLGGEFIFLCSFYNVVGGFKNQSFFYPAFLLRYFILRTHFPAALQKNYIGLKI
jgi:hypothetical protein